MNVGIDISQVVYEGTGSARYVDRLVRGLSNESVSSGLKLTLFGSAMKKNASLSRYYDLQNTTTRFFPMPPRFFEFLWNTAHVVPFEQFAGTVDIYHSSDWTQAPSKAKKVTTVHDLIPFLFPDYVHPRIQAAHKARWKWIVQEVNAIIVDAECTKKDIVDRFGLAEGNIHVIPLGVEQRFIDVGTAKYQEITLEQEIVLKTQNLEKGKYILSVGTLEPRKNIHRLVSAYIQLPKELRQQYPLVIVGKKAWAENIVIPTDIDVRFTGYVEDEQLPILYACAALFVMPSLYEGFGFPVVEAMATKTPVLASRLSSLPELGGTSIRYFNSIEDIDHMSRDLVEALQDYPADYVESAFERAKKFTWGRTVEETVKVYNTLI